MSHDIPITLNFDVDLNVSYEVEGRYYPQTLETPAEYPELLILSAIIAGTTFDLLPMLAAADEETLKKFVGESLSDG
tara:strand:- start:888 stop:1118 length:231 start_codon:yes stop_codon:yes gene_type:complete